MTEIRDPAVWAQAQAERFPPASDVRTHGAIIACPECGARHVVPAAVTEAPGYMRYIFPCVSRSWGIEPPTIHYTYARAVRWAGRAGMVFIWLPEAPTTD